MKGLIISLKDSVAFKAFLEKTEEKAGEWESVLRNSGDVDEMFRAQGALNFFDYVKDLPDLMILEAEQDSKEQTENRTQIDEEY